MDLARQRSRSPLRLPLTNLAVERSHPQRLDIRPTTVDVKTISKLELALATEIDRQTPGQKIYVHISKK